MRLIHMMMMVGGLLSACSDPIDETSGDFEAESEEAIELGKADADDLAGVYRWMSTKPYWNNDIPSLELFGQHYVRSRCYGFDCEKLVPQSGERKLVRSGGKTYLKFMSFTRTWDDNAGEWLEAPAVADTFEIAKTTRGIKLRKTYSSRWIALDKVSLERAGTASGGAWTDAQCTCEELPGQDWSHYNAFFPGLGGCFEIFAANEDGCSSTGSYTDDDATAIGTYCHCPLGTYETLAGCEAI